ncbi:pyridoxal 5'-phosphate synthase glutaminase subunit PdxT [Oceanispirochaeta crateris]|uniref:Pyridoxal 5'-phosphate synthase subunit PdxT n=1 Tax=Oceanispirochaeta crateris TaxID=2518645 RepID=A0A5C1QP51_9SPIO|nr:pyridoxal 5'-phosphate synthase glutaminase subunit PdxT [Oceanispirochaeta crateris]QEN09451.1 pyridoxal 5'-phosphate synthase glutaminase subunit PdxT [Oceanispirochaeta crateris]
MNVPGILALQGGFAAHEKILKEMGYSPILVKNEKDLETIDRLILPGGESTVMIRLLNESKLKGSLIQRVREGMPLFGTCAGLILLSLELIGLGLEPLGLMDIKVKRNAYGRQIDSFETSLSWRGMTLPALFIRAPQICEYGPKVEVLISHKGVPVLVRQGKMLAASFHPELNKSTVLHRYFMEF